MKYLYYITVSFADKKTSEVKNTVFAIPAKTSTEAIEYSKRFGEFVSINEKANKMGSDWQ